VGNHVLRIFPAFAEELLNPIPASVWVVAILWFILILYLATEYVVHRRVLRRIPVRIHVNGTRGKTSVVRLIAAGLRAGGKSVYAKTSGTLTSVTDPKGNEFPVFRFSQPNIIEQLRVLRRISYSRPEMVVMECMALQPRFQSLTELKMVRSTHGVITNARPDHLDVMGPRPEDVALALAGSTPVRGRLFTGEKELLEIFATAAEDRGSTLRQVREDEVRAITSEDLAKFRYQEHAENVALSLNVCEELGVPRHIALQGMQGLAPEPGATQVHMLNFHNRELVFVNAFAANDPESTRRIWERVVARYDDEHGYRRIAVVNCRSDRPQRSQQIAAAAAAWSRTDHFIVIGRGTILFLREASRLGIPPECLTVEEAATPSEVVETILEVSGKRAVIVGMANIKGAGGSVARYFGNRAVKTESL
jgi:poly-gamma-glutamate synthase PgsB/CapB